MRASDWYTSGTHVSVGAHRIFARVEGQGPALLFVHGYPTSSLDWAPLTERLADRYRCVAFDLLGFGASAKPLIEYDYELQWEVVEAVATYFRLTEVTLVVHDYGATLGQEALAREGEGRLPFVLRGVIFCNAALVAALHRPQAIQRLLLTRVGRLVGPWLIGERLFGHALSRVVTRRDRLDVEAHWQALLRNDGRRVMPRLLHYIGERHVRGARWADALCDTSVPVGFAWGRRDPVSGEHVLAWIRRNLDGAPVLALDVGHYPQLEAPEEMTRWLEDTLERWGGRHATD